MATISHYRTSCKVLAKQMDINKYIGQWCACCFRTGFYF